MRTQHQLLFISLLAALCSLTSGCKDDPPPTGFSADFNLSLYNDGMAPDTLELRADFAGADSYDWQLQGLSIGSGQHHIEPISNVDVFSIKLTVKSGKHTKERSESFEVDNFPPNGGSTLTVFQGNGELGTIGIDGSDPFLLPIDDLSADSDGRMDYDDHSRELYYTGSIIRSFPNGAQSVTIVSDPLADPTDRIVDLAVDPEDQRVFFAVNHNIIGGFISSVDTDGNTEFVIGSFSDCTVLDMTLHKADNKAYFTCADQSNIRFAVGNDVGILFSHNANLYALVYDNTEDWLYFTGDLDFDMLYEIYRIVPVFGVAPELVVDDASAQPILGIDILESKQQLFWSDSDENAIYRLELNDPGATPEVVFTDVTNPKALAVGDFEN